MGRSAPIPWPPQLGDLSRRHAAPARLPLAPLYCCTGAPTLESIASVRQAAASVISTRQMNARLDLVFVIAVAKRWPIGSRCGTARRRRSTLNAHPDARSRRSKFKRPNLKQKPAPLSPASVVLQLLHDEALKDHFTLDWLMSSLSKRSFGMILLLLALVAKAPGVSIAAGLLLMIPAFQMVANRSFPVFPLWIACRPLPTRYLAALVQRTNQW
jgi:hypothetical protein